MRLPRRPAVASTAREPLPLPHPASDSPELIQVLCGAALCRLHVWSDAEWAALPDTHRPAHFTRAPGLGWVGAVAVAVMN